MAENLEKHQAERASRQMGSMSCKLPLLDGKSGASDEVLSALVEVHEAARVVRMCQQTRREMSGIVSAAWALLLRCYTGQFQVAFQFASSDDSSDVNQPNKDPKPLRIELDEDENLSQFTQAAAERLSVARSDEISELHLDAINTGIIIQKVDRIDLTQNAKSSEVSRVGETL